ncbi:zinc finger, C3HC4 type family protein [Carex rostrata]
MISILAQERILGASLGAVFTGVIVFYQRRGIHRSLHECDSTSFEPIQLLPRNASSDLAHAWNETVDLTLGQLVKFLSSRGW